MVAPLLFIDFCDWTLRRQLAIIIKTKEALWIRYCPSCTEVTYLMHSCEVDCQRFCHASPVIGCEGGVWLIPLNVKLNSSVNALYF